MKKLMLCLLCLALIFSGCQAQPVETTAAPTVVPTETQPAETEAPVEVKVPPVREPLPFSYFITEGQVESWDYVTVTPDP